MKLTNSESKDHDIHRAIPEISESASDSQSIKISPTLMADGDNGDLN